MLGERRGSAQTTAGCLAHSVPVGSLLPRQWGQSQEPPPEGGREVKSALKTRTSDGSHLWGRPQGFPASTGPRHAGHGPVYAASSERPAPAEAPGRVALRAWWPPARSRLPASSAR